MKFMKKGVYHTILFPLLYASCVSLVSYLFTLFPLSVVLQMEYPLYDKFQRDFVVNDPLDLRFPQYAEYLQEVVGINLDSDYFMDPESDRIRRDSLAKLLVFLSKIPDIQAVFLDFSFYPYEGSAHADSMLESAMRTLGDKLVLPFEMRVDTVEAFSALSAKNIHIDKNLVYAPHDTGYVAPMYLLGDDLHRYHLASLEDRSYVSAIQALIEAIASKSPQTYYREIPPVIEINYLLDYDYDDGYDDWDFDNFIESGGEAALNVLSAQQLLSTPKSAFQEELRGNILFIGLFQGLDNKYGYAVDKFETPISADMPGILVLLNTYLNIVSKSYFHRVSWLGVFILNVLLALLGMGYTYLSAKYSLGPNLIWQILVILGSIGLFFYLFQGLYYFFHMKFPFVITTLFFVRIQYLYKQI